MKNYKINGKLVYSEILKQRKKRVWDPADYRRSPQGSGIYHFILNKSRDKSIINSRIIK